MSYELWALIAAAVALAYSGALAMSIVRRPLTDERIKSIYLAIKEGAMAYLRRQYMVLLSAMAVIAAALGVAINWQTGASFAAGACCSALAGYIGMRVAVESNGRTAAVAHRGVAEALKVAFRGGAVMGLCMVGLALLGISLFYMFWRDPLLFAGFGFGGSLVALFARIGGGIYTKSADVGADLVGKVEAGIPEDDPRNPAVIADAVGDNVGDVAGMAADLFETYAVTIIGAMLIGWFLEPRELYLAYPMMLGAIAIFATIIGTFFVRIFGREGPTSAVVRGIVVTAA